MRHGRVFRSDSLASLSDADIRYVVATLGLRSAVDLRAGHEVAEHPHRPVVDAGADEVMFLMQMGTVPQDAILESITNLGRKVLPRFR